MIDLTDEAFEDAEVPRHYISWLTNLIQKAKINPNTMDQRLDAADISSDIIVIEDPEENHETNTKSTDESQETKVWMHFFQFKISYEHRKMFHNGLRPFFDIHM